MQRAACTLWLIAILCVTCCAPSSGQEAAESLPPLPEIEEAIAEGEEVDAVDENLWMPTLFTASTGPFTDYLRRGHVYSEIDFATLSVSDKAFQTNGDFVVTPRFQLGWESESGFGVRGKYWEYESDSSHSTNLLQVAYPRPGAIGYTLSENYDLYLPGYGKNDVYVIAPGSANATGISSQIRSQDTGSYEIEGYQHFLAGRVNLVLGAGLKAVSQKRYLLNAYPLNSGSTIYSIDSERIDGFGFTTLFELYYPILQSAKYELNYVTGGRFSYIPISFDYSGLTSQLNSVEDSLWINEGNVGLELLSRHRYITMRLRGQFETQYWNSSVTDNQGFTGTSVSFGVDW